jgi:hypothetical protein
MAAVNPRPPIFYWFLLPSGKADDLQSVSMELKIIPSILAKMTRHRWHPRTPTAIFYVLYRLSHWIPIPPVN